MINIFEQMAENFKKLYEQEEEEIKQQDRFHDEEPEEKEVDIYDYYGVSRNDFYEN